VADWSAIEVVTTRHAGFLIPSGWIGVRCKDGPIEKLAQLEIWPDGSAIEAGGPGTSRSVWTV